MELFYGARRVRSLVPRAAPISRWHWHTGNAEVKWTALFFYPQARCRVGKTVIKIGPADHGRRMSLKDFDHAEVKEGRLYELGRGVIVVWDIPHPRHLSQLDTIRQQLYAYDLTNPDRLYAIAGISDCKLMIWNYESERHPDIAVYKERPPKEAEDVWSIWIPELVVEVVAAGSEQRDYVDKREEYLDFGVREYWIFDADRQEMLVLRRSGKKWVDRVVRPPEVYKTRLLPGLEFSCETVFRAANRS